MKAILIARGSTEDQTCKLLKLQMSLNRKINDSKFYNIGNSTIELENKIAKWIFK